uniref:Uncharacterized protein n=1 Tax=Sinocyclocheilus grahami TaxID=75366 RepID=A0A672QE54_SINGR
CEEGGQVGVGCIRRKTQSYDKARSRTRVNIGSAFQLTLVLLCFTELIYAVKTHICTRIRHNRCLGCVCIHVWGGAIKIGARPFWGRGVFALVI